MSIAKFLKQTIFGTPILRPNYDARHLGSIETSENMIPIAKETNIVNFS